MAGRPMSPMPEGDPWPAVRRLLAKEAALRRDEDMSKAAPEPIDYWSDIGAVLEGWRGFRSKDGDRLGKVRDRLANGFYGLYLSDKHFEMEAAGLDAE